MIKYKEQKGLYFSQCCIRNNACHAVLQTVLHVHSWEKKETCVNIISNVPSLAWNGLLPIIWMNEAIWLECCYFILHQPNSPPTTTDHWGQFLRISWFRLLFCSIFYWCLRPGNPCLTKEYSSNLLVGFLPLMSTCNPFSTLMPSNF